MEQWRGLGPRRRGLCLAIALLCCISVSVAGTLAHTGIGATAANRFVQGGGGGGVTQMTVNKIWSGGSEHPEVQVQLYREGVVSGTPAILNGGNGWTHTWENLPQGYVYTVDEVNVPANYTKKVMKNSPTSYTITNTYSGGGGGDNYTSVKVEKDWAGDANPNPPKEARIQLYRGGKALGKPVELNAENNWKHTWGRLEYGPAYSVDEVDIPEGYTKAVTNRGNTWTVTNTYDAQAVKPGAVDVTVTKGWSGEAPHPGSAEIAIYQDGVEWGRVMLNAANQWTHTWRDLSNTVTWTVDEPVVPDGYTKTVTPRNTANSYIITNKKSGDSPSGEPGDEPTDGAQTIIRGTKVWRHGSNPKSAWPEAVTIYIMDGKTTVQTLSVTQADEWKFSATLPKYRTGGEEISYIFSEKAVPGYRAVVSGDSITNIHESGGSGGPKTGDNNVMMLWFALMLGSAMCMKLLLGNVELRKWRR